MTPRLKCLRSGTGRSAPSRILLRVVGATILAILLGTLFLSESLTASQLSGMLLIAAGLGAIDLELGE